jgi:anti-anti-sigma factor
MFSMDLGPDAAAGLVVVALRGELDLVDAPYVATALGTVAARDRWIIVNLAGLEFIDAAGVAALARGRILARNTGGGLLLAGPHGIVLRVLTLLWDADGSVIEASVAAAAARTRTRLSLRSVVTPGIRAGGSPTAPATPATARGVTRLRSARPRDWP